MPAKLGTMGPVLTLLYGAMVVDGRVAAPRDILIDANKIRAVGPALHGRVEADVRVDLSGHWILPGAIDGHVHFEEPGHTDREDFATGTRAAAAGGITTVVEHPLTDPPTTTASRFKDKVELVGRHAYVDFGLWGGAIPDNTREFAGMRLEGASGFKAFTVDSEPDYPAVDDDDLLAALRTAAGLAAPIVVHAESNQIVAAETMAIKAERTDPVAWALSRPPISELRAVERSLELARRARANVQLAHLSVPQSFELAQRARKRGVRVRTETCPHYLLLDEDDLARDGPWAKCAPPLRTRSHLEGLWDQLRRGRVDFLASDHAPWTKEEKRRGASDIWAAPNGFGSLQFMTSTLLTAAEERGIPLPALVRMLGTNLSRWLGWYPVKGDLRAGAYADLAVYVSGIDRVLAASELQNRQKWTPWDGRRVRWAVVATMLRGQWVYRDGHITEPSRGRFVPAMRAA